MKVLRNGDVTEEFLFNIFEKFQKEFKLFSIEIVPKFYRNENGWIIESLSNDWKKCEEFDILHLKMVLKTLAKLHAGSIVYQTKTLDEGFVPNGESKKIEDDYCQLLDELNESENRIKVASMLDRLNKKESYYKVLVHGNMCGNATLKFRYENDFPVECKLEYFRPEYSSPAKDILHFIFSNTNRKVRQRYFHILIEFYHDCLKVELKKADLKIEGIISWDDFQKSIHQFLPEAKLYALRSTDGENKKSPIFLERKNELKEIFDQSIITVEDCYQIVRNKLDMDDYELIDFHMEGLGRIGGFLGDHNKLLIRINVFRKEKSLRFFVKCSPESVTQKKLADGSRAFIKEAFMYEKIFAAMLDFGIDSIEDCITPVRFIRHSDVIVFDDLNLFGFEAAKPREPLDKSTLEIILGKLARLHASNIILENKISHLTGETYRIGDHFRDELRESFFVRDRSNDAAVSVGIGIKYTDFQIDLFAKDPDKLKVKSKRAFERCYEDVQPSKEFRNVICHGDLWSTNFMLHHRDDIVDDCKIIDFQILRYCPPAHDLLCVLYLTTNRAVRGKHFQELVDFYYDKFRGYLIDYGYNPDDIYSYENFMKSCRALEPQAVCQSVLYYHGTIIDPDMMKELMRKEEDVNEFFLGNREIYMRQLYERDPIYHERHKESITDLAEMCEKYF